MTLLFQRSKPDIRKKQASGKQIIGRNHILNISCIRAFRNPVRRDQCCVHCMMNPGLSGFHFELAPELQFNLMLNLSMLSSDHLKCRTLSTRKDDVRHFCSMVFPVPKAACSAGTRIENRETQILHLPVQSALFVTGLMHRAASALSAAARLPLLSVIPQSTNDQTDHKKKSEAYQKRADIVFQPLYHMCYLSEKGDYRIVSFSAS